MSIYSPNPYSVTPDPPGTRRTTPLPERSLAHDYLEYRELVESIDAPACFLGPTLLWIALGWIAVVIATGTAPWAVPGIWAAVAGFWLACMMWAAYGLRAKRAAAAEMEAAFPEALRWVLSWNRRALGEASLTELREIPSNRNRQSDALGHVTIAEYRDASRGLQ